MSRRLTFFDIETTGFSANKERIIEIGSITVENNKVVKQFNTVINPNTSVPNGIKKMTGITDEEIEKAPLFENIADELLDIFNNSIFVAHNVHFDYSFTKMEFQRLGITFTPLLLCSVRVSRYFYPQYRSHSLDSVINRFNLDIQNRHRALDDALIIHKFFNKISKTYGTHSLQEAINKLTSETNISNNMKLFELNY